MIKAPDLDAVYAAELGLAQARDRTLDGGRRAWLSMKSALARPSSLAFIAASGFCGGWLVGHRCARPSSRPEQKTTAGTGVIAGFILPFVLRAASRIFPLIVSRAWTKREREEPCTVVQTTVIRDGTA